MGYIYLLTSDGYRDSVDFRFGYRVGHEITYGGKWGTIESIYYKVGDTLLLQKDIDFK